jgi:hypothetical protein
MKAGSSASRPLGLSIKTRKLLDCREREAEPGGWLPRPLQLFIQHKVNGRPSISIEHEF